ncbi:hypothetical protein DXG03_004201 [Asterophora parasitica]|uniref:Phospho-2-dehydro-3-deoxyheptonate aldolase n=1 Tax=Asterophora parasitica TaxID=117018 RepID=A0A9P7G9U5_9AGAR|nr:hypothetical protein DXG03_004201 [Asterophora parasitica]
MYNVSPFPDFEDAEKVQQYIQDRRVIGYDPLVQPALLRHEIVSSAASQKTIASARYNAARILAGHDDRVLVVVGLINDPDIDGSFKINKGLRIARQLLCDLTDLGIPVGSELLDTISPQFIADLMSWGAIGARTTESQLHRELASGTSFPIGFKNGTDGSVSVAIDAMGSASNPHAFMGVTEQGLASIVKTRGNKDVHVILRGGTKGPNYASEHVKKAAEVITKKREWASIMVDCSHGNSNKNHNNQPLVVDDICTQLRAGERNITGVMIESHINEGRQDVPDEGPQGLKWGVSITDACVDWERTVGMLDRLNEAVSDRRKTLIEASFSRPAAFERAQAEAA